jgi:nitroimidazol reductase NimA-like FMN-containing flavoprotein (pyridoxamine 5'-phosphate oxidase superfamily)
VAAAVFSYSEVMSEASLNPHIAEFLQRNHIAVLATADKKTAAPHAAAVYYATDSHLNIYFLTKDKTAKSRNIESNPMAAMAVYEADSQRIAQITGTISRVTEEDMMERAKPLMARFSKQTSGSEETPISKLSAGEYVLYRLTPQSTRLGEYKYGVHSDLFDIATPAEESLE